MRVPKTEWEGATLRNSRVACNSLLPLRSPTTSSERYQSGLDRHMANLGEALQGQGMAPRLPLVLEDVRLLVLRLAHQESLSVDCGGGASRSNVQLIPYQMQVAAHLVKASGSGSNARQAHRLRTICSEFVETCRFAEGYVEHGRDGADPGGAVGSGSGGGVAADGVLGRLHECAGFVAVLALLLLPREDWEECKRYIVEQMIRHAGARKARGVEGSGVEGRGGRRRSRSFAGASGGSPRVSASNPSQPGGGSTSAASTGKRKRPLSNAVSSGTGVDSSAEASREEGAAAAGAGVAAAVAAEEGEDEEAAAERERQEEEDREAEVSAARPALVFCRVVDALQSALKPRQDAAVAAAANGRQEAIILEIFLSGGDDLLLAASRSAHEAYESAVRPVGSGGGVVEVLGAMGLKRAFARWAWRGEERKEKGGKGKKRGEKEVAAACRERVMNLLCEGDLLAVAGYRTSA